MSTNRRSPRWCSDWTGIPVGRMVADEVETVLKLAEILERRIVGQSHGLSAIAKRIETNRAKLDNPNKPIGVFMLCGPSGVGKTETALALGRDALWRRTEHHHHQHVRVPGSPHGFDAEGGRLRATSAMARADASPRPCAVAPTASSCSTRSRRRIPTCTRYFFQVFDKGVMEDGTGPTHRLQEHADLLTSNVGTDVIMAAAKRPTPSDPDALAAE